MLLFVLHHYLDLINPLSTINLSIPITDSSFGCPDSISLSKLFDFVRAVIAIVVAAVFAGRCFLRTVVNPIAVYAKAQVFFPNDFVTIT